MRRYINGKCWSISREGQKLVLRVKTEEASLVLLTLMIKI